MFQEIRDSGIEFTITSFDKGFKVTVGAIRETIYVEVWDEVEPVLIALVLKHFPDSDFAKAQS